MINFTVLTDTPARLANFLVSRGIVEQKTDPRTGATYYAGVRGGIEFIEIPNPIVTDPGSGTPGEPGYVPPTHDTRRVFMVKFAHESEAGDADGPLTVSGVDDEGNPIQVPVPQYERTKFGKWVRANSSPVTAPANYTINGEPVGDAHKVNGQNVWLIEDRPERFGVWQ